MNDWARTRKRIILSLLLTAVTLLIIVPAVLLFYRAPTCSDGKLNGDEKGIDCGGSCQRLCTAESLPMVMKGDPQILKIASSTYEVVALVDNPNASAEILHAYYSFKLYTRGNPTPIKTITGQTYVPSGGDFTIFEGPFVLTELPSTVVLEWNKDSLEWHKAQGDKPDLAVKNSMLTNEKLSPHLEADIENHSLETVSHVDLTALLSDQEGNTFAASKTFVDTLKAGESAHVIFSWPKPFTSTTSNIQIITRVFPDESYLR
jgi:hypothetical protein